ncbi:hypothetical protein MLD38_031621 [Melastoma candidum]|uniref:Uncharacterized protein n=1 Tax=Melastoma candidum TaxID=119954 RepID=A0ACB9MPM0_9MYRT|nr:hypothetical protein MLD38_031621 [Melastoma candidum]
MVFGWNNRGRRWRADNASRESHEGDPSGGSLEIVVPGHFMCPISLEMMKDPVTLSSGIAYDRESIERWLEDGNFTCPVTNQVLRSFDLIPNHTIWRMIQDWCTENRFSRIPTPRVPVTPCEVTEVLAGISDAAWQGDSFACLELVQRIKKWGGESERNRRCIVVNSSATSLTLAFTRFAAASSCTEKTDTELMEALMSALNWMFPLGSEARHHLGSPAALRCMVQYLKNGNLSIQRNAILVLKEVCRDSQNTLALVEVEGVHEILLQFVKHPIHPALTKASLSIMFCLIASSDKQSRRLVGLGAVVAVLESLVDTDKSQSEKALGVLDGLIGCEEGMGEAYSNALTVPLIVKKILHVSELATEYSISILLNLCRHEGNGKSAMMEALQVGAFQKLLVLLQVGCGNETREKGTELLKLMNPYRDEMECIESVDFKNLKRSF